ncbi:MAG: 30S ribosomal protein S20 [Opitutaceae bacterium]|nr:30S ribosomal protein S20 [Opitutaceae bacterium]
MTSVPAPRYLTPHKTINRNQASHMANTKSAIKAARKTERFTARNQTVKTRLKTLHKKFEAAAQSGDAVAAKAAAIAYTSAMDKATKSGVVHKNAAARAKSHAAKYALAK